VQIERFGHAAIRVRDLSVAESFYGSLLGFAVAYRYPDDNEVIFRVGNDDQLLVQAVGRQAAKADPALPGLHHIAFVVAGGEPGLQRMRERLEQNDVAYRTLDHGDHRSVYFHDPDGNQVELYQAPERIRRTPRATTALQCARAFVYGNARRVERALFEVVFEEGDGESLVSALSAYRNGDGGFGHALEPDLRAASSQPLHTETALLMLKQAGVRRSDIADTCCDYLAGVARNDAALPAFTAGALDYPAAAHWQAGFGAQPSLDRTCGIVASLAWHGAKHPWFGASPAIRVRSGRGSTRRRHAQSHADTTAIDARSGRVLRCRYAGRTLRPDTAALRTHAGNYSAQGVRRRVDRAAPGRPRGLSERRRRLADPLRSAERRRTNRMAWQLDVGSADDAARMGAVVKWRWS